MEIVSIQCRGPEVDFAKSIILTSPVYEEAVLAIRTTKENIAKEKERQKQGREESKKMKAVVKEEANAWKVAKCEEVAYQKIACNEEKVIV